MTTIHSIEVEVEVTVKEGDSSTQRGTLLESLAKRVMAALQYNHVQTNVRVTGCELDIIATEQQTDARVSIECKAYRDRTISADVLTKMLGNMFVHDYTSTWLITTARLGKDAAGLVESFRSKSVEQRQRLRIYEPNALVELLVSVGQIKDPSKLELPATFLTLPNRTLLLTDVGEFWAVSAVGPKSGIADTVMVFDAQTGRQITNQALVQQLSERDSNLRELRWIAGEDELAAVGALADASLRQELDNIAPVPVADDWSDYRPARPQDFVGRDDLLKSITAFFDEVRLQATNTRLLAIKAPSGWGKSSFLVKLRETCLGTKLRDRVFLYAVDCRTASSARYPELALKRCLDEAIQENFVFGNMVPCRITSAGQPFSDESVQAILEQLRREHKTIVLFFDQFEEITTKQELSDLFIQVKMLCAAIESAGENIVLGFSWKTDGSIPTDHPAYHIWHSFADRRKEFELSLFSKRDTAQLLTRLSKELNQAIEPSLRRLLTEHCQGYPWLLKKLCVHVFRVLQTQPARQRELLERALDVEGLFKKDLSDLDASQISCLEKIAQDSPADHFKISEQYGDASVDALIQRRLVIRNAGKLILYWDIFRDYVLTKQVPAIPTRYMPVSSPATAKRVLESITRPKHLSFLVERLGLENGTLDNVARDLVMMGVCKYDRKNGRIGLVHANQRDTLAAAWRFLATHAFLRKLIDQFGKGFRGISSNAVETILTKEFANLDYSSKTIRAITFRLISWLQCFGIVSVDGAGSLSHEPNRVAPTEYAQLRIEARRRKERSVFVGEAAPSRVLEVLAKLQNGAALEPSDRNSLYVLNSLRLITSSSRPLLTERPPSTAEDAWLASKVITQPTIRMAREMLRTNRSVTGLEIGEQIGLISNRDLSLASQRRYGSGILLWMNWLDELSRPALNKSRELLSQK
jgi:hypothetical protein